MKKTLVLWLYLLVSTHSVHASLLKMGPCLGTHIAQNHKHTEINNTKLASLRTADCWGYHIGAFARLSLLSFYIQPEIILTNTSIQHNKKNEVSTSRLTRLDMPTMIGCSFFRTVRAQAGPIFSLWSDAEKGSNKIKSRDKNSIVGWQAGLGIDIWKLVIDLRYERHGSRWRDRAARISTRHRHGSWVLSAGVNILQG